VIGHGRLAEQHHINELMGFSGGPYGRS
jgi:hypothetical protein